MVSDVGENFVFLLLELSSGPHTQPFLYAALVQQPRFIFAQNLNITMQTTGEGHT